MPISVVATIRTTIADDRWVSTHNIRSGNRLPRRRSLIGAVTIGSVGSVVRVLLSLIASGDLDTQPGDHDGVA